MQLIASDDGFNAAGSNEESGDYSLIINGWDIYINTGSDSIDSNADIIMTWGNVEIHGTTSEWSSFDYDGEFFISGWELIATWNGKRAKATSELSTQNSVFITFNNTISKGSEFKIVDSQGNTINMVDFENNSEYIVVSSENFKQSQTYNYSINWEIMWEFTITSSVTYVWNTQKNI